MKQFLLIHLLHSDPLVKLELSDSLTPCRVPVGLHVVMFQVSICEHLKHINKILLLIFLYICPKNVYILMFFKKKTLDI